MARTLDITTFYQARYAFMQSLAWEKWAADQGIDVEPYPPGVVPSATLAAGLEAMEETWHGRDAGTTNPLTHETPGPGKGGSCRARGLALDQRHRRQLTRSKW